MTKFLVVWVTLLFLSCFDYVQLIDVEDQGQELQGDHGKTELHFEAPTSTTETTTLSASQSLTSSNIGSLDSTEAKSLLDQVNIIILFH